MLFSAWFGMHRSSWQSVPVLPVALVSDWPCCSSFKWAHTLFRPNKPRRFRSRSSEEVLYVVCGCGPLPPDYMLYLCVRKCSSKLFTCLIIHLLAKGPPCPFSKWRDAHLVGCPAKTIRSSVCPSAHVPHWEHKISETHDDGCVWWLLGSWDWDRI